VMTYTNEAMVTFLTSGRSEHPTAQGYYFLLKNKSVFKGQDSIWRKTISNVGLLWASEYIYASLKDGDTF